ncbi:hypothetical protein DSL72_002251 [Monilinia vaccinii-corymbosi]|uniref:Uncharacterized protein n=1 Tax=Monilinia vaccinii-corymbosi TaxID=61207 RepID=A0A8A3PC23_9HELO|nr:hypothetical protein DSL72_002251 [Monilinia vaccinii-corymbosi]
MCLATMIVALRTNLEPTTPVNLSMGLLVLILACAGACCHQAYTKHTASEPLLLTVEPKSAKCLKMEVETGKRVNGRSFWERSKQVADLNLRNAQVRRMSD